MTETPLTFEDAIAATQDLLQQLEAGSITESELEGAIADLVKTQNGARGFFVTYLTDERPFADAPTPATLQALAANPKFVDELLAKNVAMSTAMAITHERNQKPDLAASSSRVSQRSALLIQKLDSEQLQAKLQALKASAENGEGSYSSFLDRWGYDAEQRQAIAVQIQSLLS